MKTENEFHDFLLCVSMGRKYAREFTEGEIFHYTSPMSLENILFSDNDKENITLFASRYDCVNDTNEGRYVIKIYNDVVEELYHKTNSISAEAYYTIKSLLPRNEVLIRTYKNNECIHVQYKKCDMYICCFSTDGDSLPMWNYYSKNSKYQGYNIGIDGKSAIDSLCQYLSGVNIKWYEIIYKAEEQKNLVRKFLIDILKYYTPTRKPVIQDVITSQLTEWSMIFKNQCFEHEKEIRMVLYLPQDEHHQHYTIDYRQKDMFMIPFTRFHLARDCVLSLGISPLYCTDGEKEQQIKILKERLRKEDYLAEVIPSQIPIRY